MNVKNEYQYDRPNYIMKRLVVITMMLCAAMMATAQVETSVSYGPVPSENQLRWQDMEMYAFIHYSLNTYTDQELSLIHI